MTYKVVIADDEPIMRKAMQTLMDWESLDCQLEYVASSGWEVMEQLKKDVPDILILDIQMPGVNGIDIARYVWEQKIPSKIILLTAYADFSYAQSAIKYDVVDYVIKTGAFDDLVVAIEKAKNSIKETELRQNEDNRNVLKENFFKSVFDGTLYRRDDILERAEKIGVNLQNGWLVITIRFRLEEDKKRDYIYQSLMNFLGMVFEKRMIYGTAIKKDMLVVVLSAQEEDFLTTVQVQCAQIVEMMENFMKMQVYIGISSRGNDIQELKNALAEAEYAVEEGFFYETSKINYFCGFKNEKNGSQELAEKYLKELQYCIKKGKKEEALILFGELSNLLESKDSSTNTFFDIGIEIQSWCKKYLSEYDKSLYDVVPYERSISQIIYQCRHISEYSDLMKTIIGNTAEYIHMTVSKKNVLIYEAEKYIEENYEKSITVSEIARHVGVSLSYLSRIYKEATGNTLINFINQKKIEKAKEYLLSTDMKIYEIAEALGFENATYFSYFFKKNTGLSPKEYNEQKDL